MKNQAYHNFWQRIHKSAKKNSFPLRVMFELTYRCNFNCKHCYVPQGYRRRKRELKTKEVFFILDQLKHIGCFYLGFTGGEPFLREDIMDILWYAKKKGFEIIIYSNGSLISEKIATKLANLRPNKVDITIPAMTKESFEKITQASGSHKRVFKTVGLLYRKGINLGFKSCVLKENENEIEAIRRFVGSLGALHRLDDMLTPRLDGSREPYRYRGRLKDNLVTSYPSTGFDFAHHKSLRTGKLQVTSKRKFIDCDLEECGEKTGERKLVTDGLFRCGVGRTQAAITPLGELKMCLMIDYPKYKILEVARHRFSEVISQESNLKNAWERLKKLVASIKPDENYQCDECGLEPYCKWCPARGWLYNNKTFTSCEPESRKWAEARRQKYEAFCVSPNTSQVSSIMSQVTRHHSQPNVIRAT